MVKHIVGNLDKCYLCSGSRLFFSWKGGKYPIFILIHMSKTISSRRYCLAARLLNVIAVWLACHVILHFRSEGVLFCVFICSINLLGSIWLGFSQQYEGVGILSMCSFRTILFGKTFHINLAFTRKSWKEYLVYPTTQLNESKSSRISNGHGISIMRFPLFSLFLKDDC